METKAPSQQIQYVVAQPVEQEPEPTPNPDRTPIAEAVVQVFASKEIPNHEPKISVNRFVSEVASWYEKLRNAMELQDENIVLKNAVERILKRRLLLGGTGEIAAEPLLRELVWARYFPDNSLPQTLIHQVAHIINLHLQLKHKVLAEHDFKESLLNDWILDLMSCAITQHLKPNKEKEAMSNFMYHLLQNNILIEDDTEDTKNVQVYLAIRRAYAKDDLAYLRFHLFRQIFPDLTEATLDQIASIFVKGYAEMQHQLHYKLKEKIYLYVKRQTPVFVILEDVLRSHKEKEAKVLDTEEALNEAIMKACENRYKNISSKVRTAIIRSVFFLLLTKVAFAFLVEGTYDNLIYGHWQVKELAINIVAPPLLMVVVSLFIKTPGKDNSLRILKKVRAVLFEENPRLAPVATLWVNPKKTWSLLNTVFALLWLAAFGFSFGGIVWILSHLGFNLVSQGVFIFFITIVSFLAYRITLTAHAYNVDAGQGILTPVIDLLFLPIIKVGMRLTEGISQINPFILIFDFLIEAPFKTIFSFFEQLFGYLHSKREDLE